MENVVPNDVQERIDAFLTEEDKQRIFSNHRLNKIRVFPGNEMFHLYSEANKSREFLENGHYINVLGFGVDYLMGRQTFTDWSDLINLPNVEERTKDLLVDSIDDGRIVDSCRIDKIYAWMKITPHLAMTITESIRDQLKKSVDILWASCVIDNKAFSIHNHQTAQQMMKDIIDNWSETVTIPHKGIGSRNLLD
tara:strand:- start:1215 stop:1796 length:582 start_codon:yes stop_codon:yes gene_type:complete